MIFKTKNDHQCVVDYVCCKDGAPLAHDEQCTKPVFHASLSAAPGEQLSDDQWNSITKSYLQKMGFSEEHQFVVIRHFDRDRDHIHILANPKAEISNDLQD